MVVQQTALHVNLGTVQQYHPGWVYANTFAMLMVTWLHPSNVISFIHSLPLFQGQIDIPLALTTTNITHCYSLLVLLCVWEFKAWKQDSMYILTQHLANLTLYKTGSYHARVMLAGPQLDIPVTLCIDVSLCAVLQGRGEKYLVNIKAFWLVLLSEVSTRSSHWCPSSS